MKIVNFADIINNLKQKLEATEKDRVKLLNQVNFFKEKKYCPICGRRITKKIDKLK